MRVQHDDAGRPLRIPTPARLARAQGGGLTNANLLEAAITSPYRALSLVLGEALHPGGQAATRDLLDRASVGPGTRVIDLGCGAGLAADLARERGALPLGLDADPDAGGIDVRATFQALPLADASADVVLSECALCLTSDLEAALTEAHRVLGRDGRLAISDVTLTRPIPALPGPIADAFCLTGTRGPGRVRSAIQDAGFAILDERDHHGDLLEMRDRVRERVDYRGLLSAMGPRGAPLLEGVEATQAALEDGELGYVSIVAERVANP